MSRVGRVAATLATLLALLAATGTSAAPAQTAGSPAIELVAQSPITRPGSAVQVTVRLPGVPADGNVAVTIYGRVRSRSELAASMTGDSLRSEVIKTVAPLAPLSPTAGGARTIAVTGVPRNAGVYPLELVARDGANTPLASLVTHLIVPPAGEGSPPLAVVPLAAVSAPPVPRPKSGDVTLDDATVAGLADLVDAVGQVDTAATTLAVGPETVDALAASGEAGAAVVAALHEGAVNHPVAAQPYVAVSLDALTTAGLSTELLHQIDLGRRTVEQGLGTTPQTGTWFARDDLGAAGLHRLEQAGTKRAIVPSALIEPLPEGVLALSLAQPFLLDPPRSERAEGTGTIQALAIDPVVEERLTSEGTAALVANRAAAELATIWFEQPGVDRAAVLPLDTGLAPGVAAAVLADVAGSPVFRTTSIDDAFDTASPLLDAAGDPVHRALSPEPSTPFSARAAAAVREARHSLESARGLVGDAEDPILSPLDAQLLLATAADLDPAAQSSQSAAVQSAVDALEGAVSGPASFTLTLTSRKGTIPLTLRNESGIPLHVVIHLDSPKLDFPDGDEMPVVLKDPVTRLEIPVRSRASGALRLDIRVTTPDGEELVVSRYTVRSTAVAGAGLLLSIGAGLFLLVWWARHWHTTRRNARLVAAHAHPASAPE